MEYFPQIESMNRIGGSPLGTNHVVFLFDNIKSLGHIEYKFIVMVADKKTRKPVFFVASEVNSTAGTFGGGSHFLGLFPGDGHINMGSSDDWGSPEKFFPEALRIVGERFVEKDPGEPALN